MMKSSLTPLLIAIATSFLLVGCCTTHQCCSEPNATAAQWEYRTVTVSNMEGVGKLNALASEGWSLVCFSRNEGGSNTSTYILKKRK